MALSRRRFSRLTLFGGLATAAASSGVVLIRFLWPQNAEPAYTARIPAKDRPTPSNPYPFVIGARKAYLVSVDEEFLALLRKCPRDCTVAWRRDSITTSRGTFDHVFVCPCCGSIFDHRGALLIGPAAADLTRLSIDLESDGDVRVFYPSSPLAVAQ